MYRAVFACLLVLLAGCGALPVGGGPTRTDTVTPAPLPESDGFPPGVSAAGVEDPTALANAHLGVIDDRSYTLTTQRTVRAPNGTLRSRLDLRVTLGPDRSYLATAATAGPDAPVFLGEPPARGVYWSNGSLYLRKFTRGNTTTYNRFRASDGGAGTWGYWVTTVAFGGAPGKPGTFYRDVFRSVPTRTVDQHPVDGDTVYHLVGTRARSNAFDDDVGHIDEMRLNANVTESGLVRTLSLRYAGEADGHPVEVRWTVRYRNVGTTTVARPSWFERAV